MKTQQFLFNDNWDFSGLSDQPANLVLAFGAREQLSNGGYQKLREAFPSSTVVAGSTAREISNSSVLDNQIVATAIWFDKVKTTPHSVLIQDFENSKEAGSALVSKFDREGLRFVFVISDGQLVNGSDLVEGGE